MGIKEGNYRDGVTHIFGTFNPESKLITFLGFKCISGKISYVGFPDGEGFLFGNFGQKLHNLKLNMSVDGITKIEPGFKENIRTNFFLDQITGKINEQKLNVDELIKDESQIATINDDVTIDKLITTPIVEEDHFFNQKLKDEISGNDYKEVVNQHPRNWILRTVKNKNFTKMAQMTLATALKSYNDEHEIRAPSKLRAKRGKNKNFGGRGISQPLNLVHHIWTSPHLWDMEILA